MGGNVWEWCEDKYSPTSAYRVLRGEDWDGSGPVSLLSSFRICITPGYRDINGGFRCVLASGSGG